MFFPLPQPNDDSGYYRYSAAARQHGTPATIQAIRDICGSIAWNDAKLVVGVGDLSFVGGGTMAPHASHTDGKCVDVRPLRKDRQAAPVKISDATYDREATRVVIASFLAHRNVKKILFNDALISGVIPWAGHDNHFHVIMKT
jgi:penicillin-insensitive murein DD-endopeptidase